MRGSSPRMTTKRRPARRARRRQRRLNVVSLSPRVTPGLDPGAQTATVVGSPRKPQLGLRGQAPRMTKKRRPARRSRRARPTAAPTKLPHRPFDAVERAHGGQALGKPRRWVRACRGIAATNSRSISSMPFVRDGDAGEIDLLVLAVVEVVVARDIGAVVRRCSGRTCRAAPCWFERSDSVQIAPDGP